MDKEKIIKNICETYSPLTPDCVSEMLNISELAYFEKNAQLVREGEYSDKSFFIVKGCARAYYLKNGKDISDWFAFENDFISSIQSFFKDIPSPHFIELLEESVIIELSRSNIESLAKKYHDFEKLMRVIVTQTMLRQQERLASILFHTAQQKYENILQLYPNIEKRVPLTHIASYVGITLETLSRIRSRI